MASDLYGMYGLEDPAEVQRRRHAMTHAPAGTQPNVSAHEQVSPMGDAMARESAPDPLVAEAQQANERLGEIGLPPAADHFLAAEDLYQQAHDLETEAGRTATVTVDNPAYAPTQDFATTMRGRGQGGLEQARMQLDHVGQLVEAAQASGDPALLSDALAAHVDASRGYEAALRQYEPGLLREQEDAYRDMADAEVQAAHVVRDARFQQAQAEDQFFRQQLQREAERSERVRVQQDALQRAAQAERDAYQRLKDAESFDPNRWWSDRDTGGKVQAAVGIALAAIGGGLTRDPRFVTDMMNSQLIGPEIEKQKAQYNQLLQEGDAARAMLGSEQNLYGAIMADVQDERQADLIMHNTMLKKVMADAEAMLAEAGIHQVSAEQRASLNAIQQQIAQNELQLRMLAETTPEQFHRQVSVYSPAQQAAMRGKAARDRTYADRTTQHGWDLQKDHDIDRPKEERKIEADEAKQRRQFVQKEVSTHADKVAKWDATANTAQSLLELPNLRGQGFGSSIGQYGDLREAGRVEDQIRTLGIDPDAYGTEERLRGAIQSKMEEAQGEIEAANRRLSPEAYKEYWEREKRRNPARLAGEGPPPSLNLRE